MRMVLVLALALLAGCDEGGAERRASGGAPATVPGTGLAEGDPFKCPPGATSRSKQDPGSELSAYWCEDAAGNSVGFQPPQPPGPREMEAHLREAMGWRKLEPAEPPHPSREQVAAAAERDTLLACPDGTRQQRGVSARFFHVWCVDGEGQRHGQERSWWLTGHLASELKHEHGKAEGAGRRWDERGKPVASAKGGGPEADPVKPLSGPGAGDDPRVSCPPGTRQDRHASFGFYNVWCIDWEKRHHGPDRSWWANGRLHRSMTYLDGNADGLRREWWENGQSELETTYRNGKTEGRTMGWHENGRKAHESSWKDGKLVGLPRRWDEQGKPEPVPKE